MPGPDRHRWPLVAVAGYNATVVLTLGEWGRRELPWGPLAGHVVDALVSRSGKAHLDPLCPAAARSSTTSVAVRLPGDVTWCSTCAHVPAGFEAFTDAAARLVGCSPEGLAEIVATERLPYLLWRWAIRQLDRPWPQPIDRPPREPRGRAGGWYDDDVWTDAYDHGVDDWRTLAERTADVWPDGFDVGVAVRRYWALTRTSVPDTADIDIDAETAERVWRSWIVTLTQPPRRRWYVMAGQLVDARARPMEDAELLDRRWELAAVRAGGDYAEDRLVVYRDGSVVAPWVAQAAKRAAPWAFAPVTTAIVPGVAARLAAVTAPADAEDLGTATPAAVGAAVALQDAWLAGSAPIAAIWAQLRPDAERHRSR